MKREKYKNINFKDKTVKLDDKAFTGCSFENCVILYGGGDYTMDKCQIHESYQPAFTGSALRTLDYFCKLYRTDPQLVENLFQEIRDGKFTEESLRRSVN